MIIFSFSKRIKNFFKVIIKNKKPSENIYTIHDDRYLADIPDKDGYYRFFFPSGEVRAECHYVQNKLEGISNFYYESGKLKSKENYKNGELSGLSHFYYEMGILKSEVYYKEGHATLRKEFDESGRLIRKK
jgi:antitoxin component YwqK of YwqJK toxin-antitoxin module